MTQILPPKKDVALALLERSDVDVCLDPRAEGVVVPPQYRKEPRLILKIGLNMPVPIPDLRLDDDSMSCTLSFNRVKFFCVVPWKSVFAIVGDDGRGMMWPDDVPQELAVLVDNREAPAPTHKGPKAVPAPSSRGKGKPRLTAAREPRTSEASSAGAEARPPRARRPRKKKEEARPALRAVPSPDKSARVEKLDDRREAAASADRAPAPAPRSPTAERRGRPPATNRPKRELPPYLRVVK